MADDEADSLHLRVTVGDLTIEVDGPVDEAETWFEALREDYLSNVDAEAMEMAANGAGPSSPTSSPESEPVESSAGAAGSTEKSRSLTEYYRQTDDPTKKDSALLVGWYLEYHEDQSNFTRPEVEERAQDAKISLGANVGRDLSRHIKEGRLEKIEERDGQDAFHLTLTGEEYVENELLDNQE